MGYPNDKMIRRVLELRDQIDPKTGKQFSFRKIARRLRKGVKSVHVWYQFGTGARDVRKLGRPRVADGDNRHP